MSFCSKIVAAVGTMFSGRTYYPDSNAIYINRHGRLRLDREKFKRETFFTPAMRARALRAVNQGRQRRGRPLIRDTRVPNPDE